MPAICRSETSAVPDGNPGPSDQELLAGLMVSDGDAARAFIRRFQSKVYGIAIALTGDDHVAEDVAQQRSSASGDTPSSTTPGAARSRSG
jgi:hypothetical protein